MGCCTAFTPLDPSFKLSSSSGELLSDPTFYRRLLGKLNFLTNTRPDLAYTVQTLSLYMQNPRTGHIQATYHALHYLSKDPGLGLYLSLDPFFQIQAFCYSDWAACSDSRRSVSGFF